MSHNTNARTVHTVSNSCRMANLRNQVKSLNINDVNCLNCRDNNKVIKIKVHLKVKGCRSSNLRNSKVDTDLTRISCQDCLLKVNKNVKKILLESSKYASTGARGLDLERKIPSYAIISSLKDGTVPKTLINAVFKESNILPYVRPARIELSMVSKGLVFPIYDLIPSILRFFDILQKVLYKVGFTFEYSINKQVLQAESKKLNTTHSIESISIETNLGLIASSIFTILAGKFANVHCVHREYCDVRLFFQIINNQRFTSQQNYRGLIKSVVSGQFFDCNTKSEFESLFWFMTDLEPSTHQKRLRRSMVVPFGYNYISELRLIAKNLKDSELYLYNHIRI